MAEHKTLQKKRCNSPKKTILATIVTYSALLNINSDWALQVGQMGPKMTLGNAQWAP